LKTKWTASKGIVARSSSSSTVGYILRTEPLYSYIQMSQRWIFFGQTLFRFNL